MSCRPPTSVGHQASLDPTDPESRYKLVVDIQQQLKRVGCYWGRANGAWNNNTREAMHSFTSEHQRRPPGRQARLPAAVAAQISQRPLVRHARDDDRRGAAARQERSRRRCPAGSAAVEGGGPPRKAERASIHRYRTASSRQSRCLGAWPSAVREIPAGSPGAAHSWQPPGTAPGQPNVATAALDPGASRPASVSPSAAPKPRQAYKKSRRSGPGTPRYNLMLSLGGVY